jgi:undecaprenyl phosphate-alpha-L-ara4N flippase subunit ArnE
MLPYYVALAVGIALGIAGQILLKAGSARTDDVIAQFLNPFTIVGFAAYAGAAVFYIAAIKKIPVSLAYPSVSIGYVIVAYTTHVIWGEPFGIQHMVALALITGGILMLHL